MGFGGFLVLMRFNQVASLVMPSEGKTPQTPKIIGFFFKKNHGLLVFLLKIAWQAIKLKNIVSEVRSQAHITETA